jgi:Tol biopolymer transport system component
MRRIATCVVVLLACTTPAAATPQPPAGGIVFASDRADDLARSRLFLAGPYGGHRLLQDAAGEDRELVLSRDGHWLAFLRSIGGQTDVWIIRPNGAHPRQLTSTTEPKDGLTWSPDGTQLAFSVCAGGGCRRGIDIVGVDGHGLRRVANDAHAPSFSPDGKALVYEADTQSWGDPPTIAVKPLDGGAARRIVPVGWQPRWSPRGSTILFRGACGRGGSICIVGADGGKTRALAGAIDAVWSPDGTRVAVASGRGLGVVRLDPPLVVEWLVPGAVSSPVWARDGRRIAFAHHRASFRPLELAIASADGGVRVLHTEPPATEVDGLAVLGKRLAYSAQTNTNDHDLYILRPDGSLARLTNDFLDERDPSWSPDRSQIVFIRAALAPPHFTSLWMMRADGTQLRRLTAPRDAFDGDPTWSPDGATIAFVRRGVDAPASRVELLDLRTGAIAAPRLPRARYSDVRWSSDGRWLALVQGTTLALVHPDGSGLRPVATSALAGAAWSPDSAALGFVRALAAGANGLSIVDLATGRMKTIAGGASPGEPAWSPDGSRLAFVRGGDLYTLADDGSDVRPLTQEGGSNVDPDWR